MVNIYFPWLVERPNGLIGRKYVVVEYTESIK